MLLPISKLLTCRLVLAVMLTTCYTINGVLLFNFFIGIVEMAKEFRWDTSQQSYLMSAYYIGAVGTKVPAGTLSDIIGPKLVIGVCTMAASLLTILTPVLSTWSLYAAVVCRLLVGVTLGACLAPFLPLLSGWVSSKDNSKYASCLLAINIGGAIANPLGGFLISSYGWRSFFYATGTMGLVWAMIWFVLVYDYPSEHPRISHEELERIQKELALEEGKRRVSFREIPWRSMLKSVPLWALVVNFTCFNLSSSLVTSQLPIYFDSIYQLPIEVVGIFSSIPYIGAYVGAIFFSYFADFLRQKTSLSTTTVRKLFSALSMLLPGGLLFLQTFYGDILWVSIVAFTAAFTISGSISAGQVPNGLDLAPNFSGVVSGIFHMFSVIPGCFSPNIVALLVTNPNDFEEWRKVHILLFVVNVLGALEYLIWGSGDVQKWNSIQTDKSKLDD